MFPTETAIKLQQMKKLIVILFALAPALLCSLNLNALEVGDKAPAFEALDDRGKPWKSESFRGKKLLLVYFYPAAMTGGCTKQACADFETIVKMAGEEC